MLKYLQIYGIICLQNKFLFLKSLFDFYLLNKSVQEGDYD